MRPIVVVLTALVAASSVASACGGESVSNSANGGDSDATGGSATTGGSPGSGGSSPSGGSSGSGGSAGTGTIDFAACETSNDCVVTTAGCCGGCEPLDFRDVVAVNGKYLEAFHSSTCGPVACGACADYFGPPLRPWYGAACRNGRCAPYDARIAASCSTDGDCHLRDGVACCEGCGDVPAERLVAISSPEVLHSLACDVDTACVTCDGTYPPGAAPVCVDGLCAADLNLR